MRFTEKLHTLVRELAKLGTGDRRSIGRRTATSPCLMAARSSSTSAMRGFTRIEWTSASVKGDRSHREPRVGGWR